MADAALFARFVPLNSLVPSDRAQLAKVSRVVQHGERHVVCREGDLGSTAAFLVEGELEIRDQRGTQMVKAGSAQARNAVAPGQRRDRTVVCLSTCQVLYVPFETLDLMLAWSQTGGVEVKEFGHEDDGEGDWMTALIQSPAFARIPPANIAQIFAAMEPTSAVANQDVIRQGEPGDYYYVISQGTVEVLVEGRGRIAELGVGQGFGEEALVSGDPRNATVRALTKVDLMRLSAKDFQRLLKAPLLKEVTLHEHPKEAMLVDVRVPGEFLHAHVAGAINIPLSQIREVAAGLKPGRPYVVYCDSGRRSASAAYLLSERGLDARMVKGGVAPHQMQPG